MSSALSWTLIDTWLRGVCVAQILAHRDRHVIQSEPVRHWIMLVVISGKEKLLFYGKQRERFSVLLFVQKEPVLSCQPSCSDEGRCCQSAAGKKETGLRNDEVDSF